MRNLPVHWTEGMFLRPQHFQAAERHWQEALHTSQSWDSHYHYGVRKIRLSEEAIANFQIQLDSCHARLRDGTLIVIEPGNEPDRVDLKAAFESRDRVDVFLAMPKLKMGAVNVAIGDERGQQRFEESVETLQDESRGGNDQEIGLKRPSVRVMLDTQDTSGYELLPIARVLRAGDADAAPRIDQDYIPPLLAIDAWPGLGRDIVRAIYDIIGQKVDVLGNQVADRDITLVSSSPRDVDRWLMLMLLNPAYATLGVTAFAAGIHPLVAYTQLCQIVGSLGVFAKGRRIPELPRYDHDDLARIFKELFDLLRLLLGKVEDVPVYERRLFVGEGLGMQVSLESKWLSPDWEWFVGVLRGQLTARDALVLVSDLDWKLGSSREVERIFRNKESGVRLDGISDPPHILPSRDWVFYKVSRDNVYFRDVYETQTLALRLREDLIVDLAELPGKDQITVRFGGHDLPLQFALFAVPKRQ